MFAPLSVKLKANFAGEDLAEIYPDPVREVLTSSIRLNHPGETLTSNGKLRRRNHRIIDLGGTTRVTWPNVELETTTLEIKSLMLLSTNYPGQGKGIATVGVAVQILCNCLPPVGHLFYYLFGIY